MRINRFLSSCGLGSRRKAEGLVKERRVRVNGKTISDLSFQVSERDQVQVDEKIVRPLEPRFYLLNKPRGVMVSHFDPHFQKLIYDYFPDPRGLFSVGRLDVDSQGLIFVTNRGDLAQKIAHPSHEMEKEYWVLLNKAFDPSSTRRAIEGVQGKEEAYRVDVMEPLKELSLAKKRLLLSNDPDPMKMVRVVLHEGKKREVRRIFEALGYRVERLLRVRIGPVSLGDLPPGHYREILPDEQKALFSEIREKEGKSGSSFLSSHNH